MVGTVLFCSPSNHKKCFLDSYGHDFFTFLGLLMVQPIYLPLEIINKSELSIGVRTCVFENKKDHGFISLHFFKKKKGGISFKSQSRPPIEIFHLTVHFLSVVFIFT